MAIDEEVTQAFALDPAQRRLVPLVEMPVQIFLRNEVAAATGNAYDTDVFVHLVNLWLILEAAGEDVDLVPELGEFLRQFKDIDNLAACIGGPERRLCSHVAMRGNERNARRLMRIRR